MDWTHLPEEERRKMAEDWNESVVGNPKPKDSSLEQVEKLLKDQEEKTLLFIEFMRHSEKKYRDLGQNEEADVFRAYADEHASVLYHTQSALRHTKLAIRWRNHHKHK